MVVRILAKVIPGDLWWLKREMEDFRWLVLLAGALDVATKIGLVSTPGFQSSKIGSCETRITIESSEFYKFYVKILAFCDDL